MEKDEIRELRAEVAEVRSLVRAGLELWVRDPEKLDTWLEDRRERERLSAGTPIYTSKVGYQWVTIMAADFLTLEEVAAAPRAEVASIKGVGPITMKKLDAALADRGLTYAEAS